MSTFTDLRAELAARRADSVLAATELAVARERLRDVRREIVAVQRVATDDQKARLAALEKQATTLDQEVGVRRRRIRDLRTLVRQLVGRLTALADPPEQLAELDDDIPILLFPVRLETRFRLGVRGDGHRLSIRIYPDDVQVDSFEELLSATEIANARDFWVATWRAGRVEAQARGAWRALVGGSGSGRAAYIVEQYAPVNPGEAPRKIDPQDVVLVILPAIDVTTAERDAAFAYHVAVWRAEGDAVAQAAALAKLEAAVGVGEAGVARAREIRAGFAPDPVDQDPPAPFTRAQVRVACAVLRLPAPPPTKTTSWSQAPRAFALPDRFVALLFNRDIEVKRVIGRPIPDGLAVGPDPSLPPDQQIQRDGDDIVLNDDLRWLADYERAVEVGMGIDVPMSAAEASAGFDRLIVVGLRFASDELDGREQLETLISHHSRSRRGFGLIPQGSPTNNTGAGGAGYTWLDDPDASYDIVFNDKDAYAETPDVMLRRDGQWLGDALGVDDELLKRVPNAAGKDQAEARAMNIALWPATGGYQLEEMLAPLFSAQEIADTRSFFTRYVSGRGALPGVRVGQQPYGVLPVMTFASYRANNERGSRDPTLASSFLQRLHGLLSTLDDEWRLGARGVAFVGQPGDAHQTLLDIIGLHSGSVEYHQRYASSFEQLYNLLLLKLGEFWAKLLSDAWRQRNKDTLTRLGADPATDPPILGKYFFGDSPLLTGPLVDTAPLSESAPIRAYPDGRNYIRWLATSTLDEIRLQDFGTEPAPTALLYLMLRHAMMLGHWDAAVRLLERSELVEAGALRREPAFINIESSPDAGQSKFRHLYDVQPSITGDETTTLAEYVMLPSVLGFAPETEDLREVVAALKLLADAPTARLERVFAEHIDCCSYRLDAWKGALTAARLEEVRTETPSRGIYLGAFGWLENLRPRLKTPDPVSLEGELAAVFARPGDAPLVHDPANAGYIHGPSLNHAATAAILNNAYRVNATPANPDAMAVNLTSKRVRRALDVLEGMRNGQTLGALLGYRFERGLHDDHALAEVDSFIYPLRQVFPLVSNKLRSTADPAAEIKHVEARNVIDGLALVKRRQTAGRSAYPFGFPIGPGPGELPPASATQQQAIDAEADALAALHDAVADLVMAESVYQVVLGNFDRAAANTSAFSKGSRPPEVQVADTPRDGRSLTHRVALHLDPAAKPSISPSAVAMTPRARADAPLNLWLAGRLPDPGDVVVRVSYDSPVLPAAKSATLSIADLGLQPIDLLHVVNLDLEQSMSELDDRIVQAIRYGPDAHPDISVEIRYTEPVGSDATVFQLAALVRSLRRLVFESRPVAASDMALPLEATAQEAAWDGAELAGRVTAAVSALTTRRDALAALEIDAGSDLDTYARKVSAAFLATALHGVPGLGTGEIHGDVRAIYDAIAAKLKAFADRWKQKGADYVALLARLPALTSDSERIALLRDAEGLIASSTTVTPPPDPAEYLTAVQARKALFDVRLTRLADLLAFPTAKLVDFAAAAEAMRPLAADHDATPLDIADQLEAIVALRATLVARVASAAADLAKRLADAAAAVAATDTAPGSQARVDQLLAAGRLVLGDELQLVPRFRLAEKRGLELEQCVNGSAALLTDLKAAGRRFPVDDWLYGLARVRPKLNAWESLAVLSEAFGADRLELTPAQLPLMPDDRWTALEFDTSSPSVDRLLYTAHFATPFARAADQCGLLLDEWPELVPASDLVSGVAFHYDRPSSQPPQVLLLALPSERTGHWRWADLLSTLNETFDSAKSRGVEPADIDLSDYAQLLPATLMAVTLQEITIATNLGINNGVYESLGG